jgi:UDP-N-acetylglucosamine diphosphorylase/glucosamine-1-phosphate N-acetyltransferase
MKICIFEDSTVSNLSPVNHLRHNSDLICGALPLIDKIKIFLGSRYSISLHCRKYLENLCRELHPSLEINKLSNDEYLFLNSNVLYTQKFIDGLLLTFDEFSNTAILKGSTIIALRLSRSKIPQLRKKIESRNEDNLISLKDLSILKIKSVQAEELDNDESDELKVLNYPSDLILYHEEQIHKDLGYLLKKHGNNKRLNVPAELINRSKIHISQNCVISRNSVLDASQGAIFIGEHTIIEPFCYIKGPAYIGEHTTVRSGSKLYGPLRIGDHCKVSGEIISSIIHSYVNKQHLGFLGHSYLCEWVNLGAGTSTSNLKNNYSEIIIKRNNKELHTGSIFLGSIIGDHTKTGINTMLNTGTYIGISSNLYGGGFHPKEVHSYSWGDASGKTVLYDIEKALKTAKTSMRRRNINMAKSYEALMRYHFKNIKNRKSF